MPRSTDPDRGQSAEGKKVTAYPAVRPEVLAAGGIFTEKGAV